MGNIVKPCPGHGDAAAAQVGQAAASAVSEPEPAAAAGESGAEGAGQAPRIPKLDGPAAEACREAAEAIADADVFLLCTGAGFSADSGLAVYKDIAQVPAYRDRGLHYHDICDPIWLDDEPDLFYGFWGMCFNDYRNTRPHAGYEMIAKWKADRFADSDVSEAIRKRVRERHEESEPPAPTEPYRCYGHAGAFFVFTSNVDAHSFDHFDSHEVRECHGNTELWQCSQPCCQTIWRAPADLSFAVDLGTMRACAGPTTTDGKRSASAEVDDDAPPRIGHVRQAKRSRMLSGLPEHPDPAGAREMFRQANRPVCLSCGGPARPAILMFGDYRWLDSDAQEARFLLWLETVTYEAARRVREPGHEPLKVCVLEIGAGKNVPTVRMTAARAAGRLQAAGASCSHIRVNRDFPGPDSYQHPCARFISVQAGGLESIACIDSLLPARAERRAEAGAQKPQEADPEREEAAILVRKVRREGGRRGAEIAGAAEAAGLRFFCSSVTLPDGDVELLLESMSAMNAEPDPAEEEGERKGGSGHVGKMIFSVGTEQLAVAAYVPAERQAELSCEEWLRAALATFGGEVISVGKDVSTGSVKADSDKGIYPLKIREAMVLEANNFLRTKGLFPENEPEDEDCVFGYDDFPAA